MRLHRDSVLTEAKKIGADDGPPIVRQYASGPFDMVSLSYEAQLSEEGDAMQHCAGILLCLGANG